MIRFEDLLDKVRGYSPDADLELLRRAYVFSALEHKGQVRHSGEPYLVHPIEVADILADMKLDAVCVAAGLLHDVVEDTLTTIERIRETFGEDVAHIVEGVTKISAITFSSSEERQVENFRKMLLAMVDDIRVIVVKLADRLHNMRTLQFMSEERRSPHGARNHRHLRAHRQSPGDGQNQERARRALLQTSRARGVRVAARTRRSQAPRDRRRDRRPRCRGRGKLQDAQISVIRIDGRIKRLYSIWLKLKRQKIDLEQVYDFVALRIVTPSVKDCYAALGIIHQTWSPVPGRIKDFIAMPRPNGYQSLHTSVISERGFPFEVQIRTDEMDRRAEEGIAAHWKYKEGRVGAGRDEQYFQWLRQLLEWQQEVRDPQEFLHKPENRSLSRRGLHLHAARAGQGAAQGIDGGRFRLCDSHRRRSSLRGRTRQRAHGAAADAPQERRHRRDRHQPNPQAKPRLAQLRGDLACTEQDQAPHPGRGKTARHRSWGESSWKKKRDASRSIWRSC